MNVVIIGDFPEAARQAIRAIFPPGWTVAVGRCRTWPRIWPGPR